MVPWRRSKSRDVSSSAVRAAWTQFLVRYLHRRLTGALRAWHDVGGGSAAMLQEAVERAGLTCSQDAADDLLPFLAAGGVTVVEVVQPAVKGSPQEVVSLRLPAGEDATATHAEMERARAAIVSIDLATSQALTDAMNDAIQEVRNLYADQPTGTVRAELTRSALQRGIPSDAAELTTFLDLVAAQLASGKPIAIRTRHAQTVADDPAGRPLT